YARTIRYTYDATLLDRVSYVQHQLFGGASWTDITSSSSLPTYLAMGGFKTLTYGNGIVETNSRDLRNRLTSRTEAKSGTNFVNLSLGYDFNSNITSYSDVGRRHLTYYTGYDTLNRLRCNSRSLMAGCNGQAPWSTPFNESFDYDYFGSSTPGSGSGHRKT